MIVAIIQARMNSYRFPGKMLKKIGQETVISLLIKRLFQSKLIDEIILATGNSFSNDSLAEEALLSGIKIFRGNDEILLDRWYRCAQKHKADIIVRITGDCPLVDAKIVDRAINIFQENSADYVSNVHPAVHPDGMDVEVFSFEALAILHAEANSLDYNNNSLYSSCLSSFFWNQKERFKCVNLKSEINLSRYRLTIDYPEDLHLLKELNQRIDLKNASMKEIIKELCEHPSLLTINQRHIR